MVDNLDTTHMIATDEHDPSGEGSQSAAGPRHDRIPFALYERPSGWGALNLTELWRYHELLYFLAWRDIKVRYKQTAIGVLWAVLQPFLTMLIFAVVFGRLVGVPSEGLPYPIFAYAALLPWTFFSTALTRASGSLVYDANLISKVYFPRLVVPLSAVLGVLIDFAIASTLLIGMLLYYGIVPGIEVLTLPVFVLLTFATALGAGLWLSALNVRYRDVGYAVPFLVQFWLFATPVLYPSSIIPERWRDLVGLNPMAGVIEGFRWALLGYGHPPSGLIGVSAVVVIVLTLSGLFYFRRMEAEFADVV